MADVPFQELSPRELAFANASCGEFQ